EGDRRDADLRGVLGGDALHGERDDLPGFAVSVAPCVIANFAYAVGGFGPGFLGEAIDQLGLGVFSRHPGQLLETAPLLGEDPLQLFTLLTDRLFAPADLAGALSDLPFTLLEDVELPVETGLSLLNAALGSLELLSSPRHFRLP